MWRSARNGTTIQQYSFAVTGVYCCGCGCRFKINILCAVEAVEDLKTSQSIMATYYYIPYADILREYLPKPSQYFPYICPWKLDDDVINGLAAEGKFPSMIDLVPALYYFAALSIARLLLQNILFKVYNIYFMI